MNKPPVKQGFSLVELMVVISIIAILSIIGSVFYSTVRVQSKNNKRINDLKVIETALEQYYADQNNFPMISAVVQGGSLTSPGPNSKTYLNPIPQDPLASSPYVYQAWNSTSPGTGISNFIDCDNSNATCNVFCLSAKLEGNVTPSTPFGKCQFIGTTAGYNYQVNSLNPNNNIRPS